MRLLIVLFLLSFSMTGYSQTYEYEPVANKAEYWISKFAPRRDMDDLMKWSEDYIDFMSGKEEFENVNSSIMVPYFINDVNSADFIWLDIYPNSTEQYAAMEELVKNGGDLNNNWPGNNVRVLSAWQWEISNSPAIEDSNGIVEYQDCMLREVASLRTAFDGYKNFASISQEAGSSMGMKMIFNESGSEGDSDYVFTIWNSSISKYGSDLDTYVNELNGTPWNKNHGDWAICKNSRTFTSIPIMIP